MGAECTQVVGFLPVSRPVNACSSRSLSRHVFPPFFPGSFAACAQLFNVGIANVLRLSCESIFVLECQLPVGEWGGVWGMITFMLLAHMLDATARPLVLRVQTCSLLCQFWDTDARCTCSVHCWKFFGAIKEEMLCFTNLATGVT